MSLIKKANELVIPSTLKMMVYGQAGMRKTTTALSSPNPLLLDFDNGVKRVNMEHLKEVDTVQISSWNDALSVLREDLSPYQTIVADTIGKMMDYIITYKCGNNIPRINDWNGINMEFSNFLRNLSNLNKNVIFVAHRDTRKEGDTTVYIPALREKNYNSIVTELDLLGYMEAKSVNGVVQSTITFDPTDRNDGKNTCNLPSVMNIPTIIDTQGRVIGKNDFFTTKVINPYLSMLHTKKVEREKYDNIISELRENIAMITDDVSANDFVGRIDAFEHVGSSKSAAACMLSERTKVLGLAYDKVTKKYINPVEQPSLL